MSRVLVLADVHANAPALDAVLAAESTPDRVLFLGDAVDNGPHPDAVCERLRELDAVGVSGNHDRDVVEVGARDRPIDDPHARWKSWTYDRLSAESRRFLGSLARTRVVSLQGRTVRLHHGDFPSPEGHEGAWQTRAPPREDASVYEALADRYDEGTVLLGHSHRPFEVTVRGTTFVNPGSVGLQRGGRPPDRARYATVEDGTVDLREVTYDPGPLREDLLALDSPYYEIWSPPVTAQGAARGVSRGR